MTGSGKLIVGNSYFSGWRAYIRPQDQPATSEVEQPITPVYGNFSLVKLPVQLHRRVDGRFRYSPPSFQVGAFTDVHQRGDHRFRADDLAVAALLC